MSKLINMEQIRAANAQQEAAAILEARGSDGDQLSGYHSLIITNGLLATLAYSADKGGECKMVALALIRHIASLQRHRRFPGEQLPNNLMDAIYTISGKATTPTLLAMMTDECMAYLNYLKRFVRARKNTPAQS